MSEMDNFRHWQSVTRKQLSVTINLVLGLSTGLLAFETSFLRDKQFVAQEGGSIAIMGALFLLISIIVALWNSLNRLKDFRLTSKIVRNKEKQEVTEDREKVKDIGCLTWALLQIQIWAFGIGSVLCILSVIVPHGFWEHCYDFMKSNDVLLLVALVLQVIGTVALSAFSFLGIQVTPQDFVRVAGKPITHVAISKLWLLIGKIGLATLLVGLVLSAISS